MPSDRSIIATVVAGLALEVAIIVLFQGSGGGDVWCTVPEYQPSVQMDAKQSGRATLSLDSLVPHVSGDAEGRGRRLWR